MLARWSCYRKGHSLGFPFRVEFVRRSDFALLIIYVCVNQSIKGWYLSPPADSITWATLGTIGPIKRGTLTDTNITRSEERRVGKECLL